ncbi:MAG TPA: hypothetical protein VM687_09975 [Stenotrophomonas sp.]|nr:hypothetical protein [Stenotrophomonas sp.]
MASDITVEAVRAALNLQQVKAEVAGWNIVNARAADGPVFVVDDSRAREVLAGAVEWDSEPSRAAHLAESATAIVDERYDLPRPSLDDSVADSVTAGLNYQALSESLGRHLALMRLAISGRS